LPVAGCRLPVAGCRLPVAGCRISCVRRGIGVDPHVNGVRGLLVGLVVCASLSGCTLVDKLSGEGEAKRIRRVGQTAEALVLEIRDTGMTLNDDPIVAFRLEVRPVSGEPYEVETRGRIGRLDIPQIQPGAVLPVAIDPADPTKVALRIYRDR